MGRWEAVTKINKLQWFTFVPSESLTELMQLRDAEGVYITLQIRNLVLMHGGPVAYDARHIGGLCDMTRARVEKVIHRLVNRFPECDIYHPVDNMISSRKAEEMVRNCQEFRENSRKFQELSVDSRNRNKENQRLKNWLASKNYLPIPYHTIPCSISNIKPIPSVNSAVRAGGDGCRPVGDVLAGMTQAIGAVCLSMRDLNGWHLREMVQRYPQRTREDILHLFNAWVERERLRPENPQAFFMSWLKSATWLAQPTGARQ